MPVSNFINKGRLREDILLASSPVVNQLYTYRYRSEPELCRGPAFIQYFKQTHTWSGGECAPRSLVYHVCHEQIRGAA
jgi:hypothetical protein